MNYQYIGQIKGAKSTSRKDKTTHKDIYNCEVTVQFEDYDKNGELVLDTQHIQFDMSEIQTFKDNINKFIAIHYIFLNVKSGSYMFPNESMPYSIYDTNPLVPNITKDKKTS